MNEPLSIRGVLLDLSGVLHVGNTALPGAVSALRRLRSIGLPLRYVTNTTRQPRVSLVERLNSMGFAIAAEEVLTPTQAALAYLKDHALRPYLLIHPELHVEFSGMDTRSPNAVVLGDAAQDFTYDNLNAAFRLLMEGAPLLALGDNRYFREPDGLSLDIGPFKTALEYAADTRARVLGKPAPAFFHQAVAALGCTPAETLMIGDDATADVDGALRAGLQGLLVRTGKYRNGDERRIESPGAVLLDDLPAAVEWILEKR
ncbi:MAG: TIGR01458 family HAD-type hydrolase [Acidihalobacter sp.]|uniref:TIGR01458 family HAD-type hydrolase n=1 Tax=Acidihalobacter sp. TaxID=1872108 RepID=UPI00307F2186